jgi:hypothetical protein
MTGASASVSASSTPTVLSVVMLASAVPLARYVRWQLTGTATWDTTFRVFVSANAPGL